LYILSIIRIYHISEYNITEELAPLESISGTTKGADIFEKVNFCIENLGLTWVRCVIS